MTNVLTEDRIQDLQSALDCLRKRLSETEAECAGFRFYDAQRKSFQKQLSKRPETAIFANDQAVWFGEEEMYGLAGLMIFEKSWRRKVNSAGALYTSLGGGTPYDATVTHYKTPTQLIAAWNLFKCAYRDYEEQEVQRYFEEEAEPTP